MSIKELYPDWEVVIGLEVHAQVKSQTKLFSGSSTKFGAEPNTQVSFFDAAMPGMLPVLNEFCLEQAVKTGFGLNAKINSFSRFDRKNYFYPDLPSGYQISQFYQPIVGEGSLYIEINGERKKVGIERLHLEMDAGKSIHDQSPDKSFIDLNRAGVALMEIVSKPDMRSADEAVAYMKKLRNILRYLDTCDGDMEKGSLRCDANVSVRHYGDSLGTRCEIKNINSFRNIARAIEYEAVRQIEVLLEGGVIKQQTRLYDPNANETRVMRDKEDALDYRYFPDPDLLPVTISESFIAEIKSSLPELPDQKIERYQRDYNLGLYDAEVLTAEPEIATYFEAVAEKSDAKLAANWVSGELFGRLNKAGVAIESSPVSAEQLAELLKLITDNVVSGKIAKQVFEEMFASGKNAGAIVKEQNLVQVTDEGALKQIIDKVLAANPDKVAEYKSGKDKLFAFFVGQVMKETGGKANPQVVNELLKAAL